jgi:hypothetical protein
MDLAINFHDFKALEHQNMGRFLKSVPMLISLNPTTPLSTSGMGV